LINVSYLIIRICSRFAAR